MPMRTLFQRWRDRDWAGVLVELLIVVVGVFLGLQASNWNQDRQDRARGADYLARIHGELESESDLLARTLEFSRAVSAYGKGALDYAEHGTLYENSAWKTLLAYYQASQVWPFRQPNTAFQELRGSGELQLIRDVALRARLASHYGDSSGSHAIEVLGVLPKYREDIRGVTPWAVQRYIWENCYQTDARLGQRFIDCAAPIPEAEAAVLVAGFRKNESLTAELRFWMASLVSSQIILGVIRNQAEEIARLVPAEPAVRPQD